MIKKFLFFIFFLIPLFVFAKTEILPSFVSDPSKLTIFLSKTFLSLGFVLSILILVIAGFRFLTSAGNPGIQKDAKDQITSAFFGLIIFFASYLILKSAERSFTKIELSNLQQQATSTETTLTSPSPLPLPTQYLKEKEEREKRRKLEVDYIPREGWKPVWPERGPVKINLFGTEVEIELFKWGEFIQKYIDYIFNLAIVSGIILAIISFIIGGIKYLQSVGNIEKQIDAKSQMVSSVFGLLLLLATVIILRTFHPTFALLSVKELDLTDIEVPEGVWVCEYKIPEFEKYLQIYNKAYQEYIDYIAERRVANTPELQTPIPGATPLPGPASVIFDWERDKKLFLIGNEECLQRCQTGDNDCRRSCLKGFAKAIEEGRISPKELINLRDLLSFYCHHFQASQAQLPSQYFGGRISQGMTVYLVGEYGAVFHQGLICTGRKRNFDAGTVSCIENPYDENGIRQEISSSTVSFETFRGYSQVVYRWHTKNFRWQPTNTEEGEVQLLFTPYSVTVFKDNGGEFYSYKELARNINENWKVENWEKLVRSVFGEGATLYTVRNFGKEEDVPWANKAKHILYRTEAGIFRWKSSPWTIDVGESLGTRFDPQNPRCQRGENCWYSLNVEKKKKYVVILCAIYRISSPQEREETCEVFDEEDSNLEDNYVSVFCKNIEKNQRFPCANSVRVFPGYVIYKAGEKPGAPFYEISQ
jgi:hypothetical protein